MRNFSRSIATLESLATGVPAMPLFTGLDLCTPVWTRWQGETTADALVARGEPKPVPAGSEPVFSTLDVRLRLGKSVTPISMEGEEDAWIREPLQEYVSQFVRQAGEMHPLFLGAAMPVSAVPPFRREFPNQLGFVGPTRKTRYKAVEAAVAAGLAVLAAGRLAPPVELLFCLDVPPHVELSVVQISKKGTELTVGILASAERVWSSLPQKLAEELAEFRRVFALQPSAQLQIWSAPATAPTGQLVAQTLGIPARNVKTLDASAVAEGAARFAACKLQFAAHALPCGCLTLQIDRVCSRPLGVVGQNKTGQYFWRRLFNAGILLLRDQPQKLLQDQPQKPQIVIDRRINPPVLLLAECLSPTAQAPLWLSLEDCDPYPLRLFTSSRLVEYRGIGDPTTLHVSLTNQFGDMFWQRGVVRAECR